MYKYRGQFAFESFAHPHERFAQGGGPCAPGAAHPRCRGGGSGPAGLRAPLGTREQPLARSAAPRLHRTCGPPRRGPSVRRLRCGAAVRGLRCGGCAEPSAGSAARLPWDRRRPPRGRRSAAAAPLRARLRRPPGAAGLREGGGGCRALPLILTTFFFCPRNQAAEIGGEAPPPPRQGSRLCCAEPGTGEGAAK